MNKKQLIREIALVSGATIASTETFLNAFNTVVEKALSEGEIVKLDIGSLNTAKRQERKGYNPATKEEIIIPARTVATFRPRKRLREAVR